MHAGPEDTPDERISNYQLTLPQATVEAQPQTPVENLPIVTAAGQDYVPPAEAARPASYRGA